jgi:hypothetical protein
MSGTRWSDDREVWWRCMRSVPCTRRAGAHVTCLSLKTKVDGLSVVWPQHHWNGFSRFDLKTGVGGFSSLSLKPTPTVWWFVSQNHHDGFLVWISKLSGLRFVSCATKSMEDENGAGHTLRFSGLLCVEASQGRVSQSSIKTGGCTTAVVHVLKVASSPSWKWTGRYNGLHQIQIPLVCRFHLN